MQKTHDKQSDRGRLQILSGIMSCTQQTSAAQPNNNRPQFKKPEAKQTKNDPISPERLKKAYNIMLIIKALGNSRSLTFAKQTDLSETKTHLGALETFLNLCRRTEVNTETEAEQVKDGLMFVIDECAEINMSCHKFLLRNKKTKLKPIRSKVKGIHRTGVKIKTEANIALKTFSPQAQPQTPVGKFPTVKLKARF